jgi:hypothetical protein
MNLRNSFSLQRIRAAGARRQFVNVLTALTAVVLFGTSAVATAVPLPASVICDVAFNLFPPNPSPLSFSSFGLHELIGPGGDLQFDSGLVPSPFLSVSAANVPTTFFGRSAGILRYDVEIVGPTGNVPIRIGAFGQASATTVNDPLVAAFALRALWSLEDGFSGALLFSDGIETPQLTGAFSDSFDRTVDLTVAANRRFRVNLLADVGIRGGSGSAFVDPIFSFGPGVGSEYSFVFSDGVGNTRVVQEPPPTAVTEPRTLALSGLALMALAFIGMRREN